MIANFQMLEEVFDQDGVEIQSSLSISLEREIFKRLKTLENSFKSYFYLSGIEVEPGIHNPFLSDINCIKDVDLAKDELTAPRTKKLTMIGPLLVKPKSDFCICFISLFYKLLVECMLKVFRSKCREN
jgi:hypothetical protein